MFLGDLLEFFEREKLPQGQSFNHTVNIFLGGGHDML